MKKLKNHEKSNLSIVVFTQNTLCNIIPRAKQQTNINKKSHPSNK